MYNDWYIGQIYRQNNKRQTLIPCNGGGFSDAKATPCTTRGGINYRKWEKIKAAKKTAKQQTPKEKKQRQAVERVSPGAYDCAGAYLIPINEIYTDTAKFQQREKEYSAESVNKIVNAVQTGAFHWPVFDPILTWINPQNGKLYVLSGHSRLAAFKMLANDKVVYHGKTFAKIPARVIDVPEQEAIKIALLSNTLATPETPLERANYYRTLMQTGMPVKEVAELANQYEGKNANAIIAFAHLNPDGILTQVLRNFQNADAASRKQAENLAQYVGEARRRFPFLTNAHEREMWDFINSAESKKAVATKTDFLTAIAKAVDRNTEFGNFDTQKPLNLLKYVYKNAPVKEWEKQVNQLKAEIERKAKERDNEFRKYINLGYQTEQINPVLKKYDNEIMILRKQYADLLSKQKQVESDAERQAALFGIAGISRRQNSYFTNTAIKY